MRIPRNRVVQAIVMIGSVCVGFSSVTAGVGIASLIAAATTLVLVAYWWTSTTQRIRRLRRDALLHVPAAGGTVILRGIARRGISTLRAPYSGRRCLAFWASHLHLGSGRPPREQIVGVRAFVLECGSVNILVETRFARVLRDPASGEGARIWPDVHDGRIGAREVDVFVPITPALRQVAHRQETLVVDGDDVVVEGFLVPNCSTAYRTMSDPALRLVGTRARPVTVVMPARSNAVARSRVPLAQRPRVVVAPTERVENREYRGVSPVRASSVVIERVPSAPVSAGATSRATSNATRAPAGR